ncbi:MAG: hypothetical protein RIC14_01215 [Filomicrobium sp.]
MKAQRPLDLSTAVDFSDLAGFSYGLQNGRRKDLLALQSPTHQGRYSEFLFQLSAAYKWRLRHLVASFQFRHKKTRTEISERASKSQAQWLIIQCMGTPYGSIRLDPKAKKALEKEKEPETRICGNEDTQL